MKKKFIELDDAEKITLQEGHKNGKTKAFQWRCHCLLLSGEGYEVKESAAIFRVSEIPIHGWFKRWEKGGICGIRNKEGHGRKPILQAADLGQIKRQVEKNAQRLKNRQREIESRIGARVFDGNLEAFLKSLTANINDGANI